MNQILDFLLNSGESLLGVVVGGTIVVIGQMKVSRASITIARDVAEIENNTARIALQQKQSALLFERQLTVSSELLAKLEDWDIATCDISELGLASTEPPSVSRTYPVDVQRREAEKILRSMHLVLPPSVTDPAKTAIATGLIALETHETNFYIDRDNNKERRNQTELDRIAALENFSTARDNLLQELQQIILLP